MLVQTLFTDSFVYSRHVRLGKSSLINMLTNTKKLAFTSKTPGKTSEFNYFDAEGVVGPDKEKHNFFLVDVPGVGYAEVNKFLRSTWLDLLQDYTRSRGTLRLICHLVDSRHGLLKADEQCLALIDSIPSSVQYVIVLTKSDKRGGEGRLHIVNEVRAKVLEYTRRDVAVILSSSDTREGGTKIWSTMLDAFAGDHIVVDAVNSN
jgi:GTP-binding protein